MTRAKCAHQYRAYYQHDGWDYHLEVFANGEANAVESAKWMAHQKGHTGVMVNKLERLDLTGPVIVFEGQI